MSHEPLDDEHISDGPPDHADCGAAPPTPADQVGLMNEGADLEVIVPFDMAHVLVIAKASSPDVAAAHVLLRMLKLAGTMNPADLYPLHLHAAETLEDLLSAKRFEEIRNEVTADIRRLIAIDKS